MFPEDAKAILLMTMPGTFCHQTNVIAKTLYRTFCLNFLLKYGNFSVQVLRPMNTSVTSLLINVLLLHCSKEVSKHQTSYKEKLSYFKRFMSLPV